MKKISTKKEYIECTKRVKKLFHSNDKNDLIELELLHKMIRAYEDKICPVDDIDFKELLLGMNIPRNEH